MISLYVIRGRDLGRSFPLEVGRFSIGRDAENPIQLHDSEVSRRHAFVEYDGRQCILVDQGSSNGTFVNGQQVKQHVLCNGDRVQFGGSLIIFNGDAKSIIHIPSSSVEIVPNSDPLDLSQIRQTLTTDVPNSSAIVDEMGESELVPDAIQVGSNWEIMYQTSLAVSRTLDIDQLLIQILDLVFQWIGCDRGCIMLRDLETGDVQPACRKNRPRQGEPDRIEISKTILDYVLEHREGVLTSNAPSDRRWDATASIVQMGIREAICVPMQGRYGIVGAIYIDTTKSASGFVEQGMVQQFSQDHLRLMVAIGHQAALAIEDTTYYRGMIQAERLAVMGQTIANLSHHIKNILQGIRSGGYIVNDGLQKEQLDLVAKGWGIVEKNQERIASLVMDMLSFSKDRSPEWQTADIRDTIDELVELMQSRAEELNLQLQWSRPLEFPKVRIDADAMHRAILNILTNAMDACETVTEPVVSIRLFQDDLRQNVVLEVQDNGVGISDEDLLKIFMPFESRKGHRGTGLGLPVSRKILREHGGDVRVRSELGIGTCFSLVWPKSGEQPNSQADLPDRPTMRD